jgi:mRNA-degrading endonuclease RelE of RelBE toxin-antitoxin system
MRVLQTTRFQKTVKKLPASQKKALDDAVRTILAEPTIGQAKIGDLQGIRVYKFKLQHQLTLLAYQLDVATETLTLLALGSHENFYRDLKH